MLQLKNITKNYVSGDEIVKALQGINLEFRENEFVSILGPSGCGKTTLLNIIGGLDRYTSGDLFINGVSTKQYKDRDWDTYRNHSIGFVFQNYNLIPHQSVLSNVELALTLSGVSKNERAKRAKEALTKVGLENQINKKPNQLSGGQMQRVAIARALVNNPDILLADEPTGALDSVTSIQIMELLKEIAKDKLVIMVTHNPELAKKYSTRIIKLLDGKVIDDSAPYNASKEDKENAIKKEDKSGKTYMNFFTALALSFNNLLTKKGRTILTAFAGSIGIIGIALILSLSNGVQNYINKIEEDTLSSYPITIEETTMDMGSMMESLMEDDSRQEGYEEGKVYSREIMDDMMSLLSTKIEKNNLAEFKKYIETDHNEIVQNANAIQYSYNLDLNLYKADTQGDIVKVNPSTVMEAIGFEMENSAIMGNMYSISNTNVWSELIDNQQLLNSQYDVLAGKWPTNYNEVVLMVSENNEISDYTLYALGLKDQENLTQNMEKLKNGEEIEPSAQVSYTYDELLNLSYKVLLNTDYYIKENNIWIDKSDDEEFLKGKIENAETINVVGIIRPKKESVGISVNGMIGYTKQLKEYVINNINESQIVKEQKENAGKNVFTGLDFPEENSQGKFDYNSLSDEQKAYMATLSEEELANLMETYSNNVNASYDDNLSKLGVVDLDTPSTIKIYPKDFQSKENIANAIETYNKSKEEQKNEADVINYTDVVGIMMDSVNTIVDVISSVLIAFVAISLVVSSIMIGIITYISVLERTKEIGILRSIGASKKDISRVFNAETFIIGIVAGAMGIGITVLLNIPINIIIESVVEIPGISALPIIGGVVLVLISMILTVIAGIIPSKMASKKDPVEALRTE